MNTSEKLASLFSKFPGVGPRQAKRFVYHLLIKKESFGQEIAENILKLKNEVVYCNICMRFFEKKYKEKENICSICSDKNRNQKILTIVQRDIDLESMEKNSAINSMYFILGGEVPILEKEPDRKIRSKELLSIVEKKIDSGLEEIIIATNWNPEGENTANFVEKLIKPITEKFEIKISRLGKGLSMGTELEYTDPDTLKNALKNRS